MVPSIQTQYYPDIKYYSVQLNQSWEEFHQDKKTFNSEHLNFPGKELNVTHMTKQ